MVGEVGGGGLLDEIAVGNDRVDERECEIGGSIFVGTGLVDMLHCSEMAEDSSCESRHGAFLARNEGDIRNTLTSNPNALASSGAVFALPPFLAISLKSPTSIPRATEKKDAV